MFRRSDSVESVRITTCQGIVIPVQEQQVTRLSECGITIRWLQCGCVDLGDYDQASIAIHGCDREGFEVLLKGIESRPVRRLPKY